MFIPNQPITVNTLLKINLANQQVVNIPAHTQGIVEEVKPDAILFRCNPPTAAFPVRFQLGNNDPELKKISPGESIQIPVPFYDADMPGFLRDDDGYLMHTPDGETEYLLYRRLAWTPWQVEVHFEPGKIMPRDGAVGVFRTTWRDGKECEQFSLITSDGLPEYCYAQVQMFKGGKTNAFSYIPTEIQINPGKHVVKIFILADLEWKNGELVTHPMEDAL